MPTSRDRPGSIGSSAGNSTNVERGGNKFKQKKRVGMRTATHKKGWDMDPDLFMEFDKHRSRS